MNTEPEKRSYCYDYPRPAVSADVVVLTQIEGRRLILLIRRGRDPFKGDWALPGGFLDEGERIEECARRELMEETGLKVDTLTLVGPFDDPDRDPRYRNISIAFVTTVDAGAVTPVAGDDADETIWFSLDDLPTLAFDHAAMVQAAITVEGIGR